MSDSHAVEARTALGGSTGDLMFPRQSAHRMSPLELIDQRTHRASVEVGTGAPAGLPGAVEISRRPSPQQRLANIWRYRELLGNLVRKELKVKYKSSILGFVWSMLNPALYIVVFSFVFGVVLKSGIHNFALFMMAGLLPWNFFASVLGGGTGSIVNNASLVTKVWFPREVLPLASVGAGLVHMMLQAVVLLGALLAFRQIPSGTYAVALLPALAGVVVFTAALAIAFSAMNVYLRDMSHLVELLTLAWFWGTPIVYQVMLMIAKLQAHGWPTWLVNLNPLTAFVVPFQRVLYNASVSSRVDQAGNPVGVLPAHGVGWYVAVPGIALAASLVLLYLSLMLFSRLEDNMAEEI